MPNIASLKTIQLLTSIPQICTDILYQPLTLLDCLHTFCGSCLREWFIWQATNATSTNPYTCPSCRAPVRGTRPNATVTTLLDVLLKANPEKAKPQDERDKIALVYKPGDNVTPPVEIDSSSDSEDQRVLEQARELSLREADRSHARRSSDRSRDRSTQHGHHRHVGRHTTHTTTHHRPRDASGAQHRHIEHQSSLRSLLSASSIDSADMQEEIMRQIIDEGLLDGVDLSSLTPAQEEDITERIAQAFRRRQREQSPRVGSPPQVDRSPQTTLQVRRRTHDERTRSTSQNSQRHHDRPPLSRPHLLEVATAEERNGHSRSSSQGSQRSQRSDRSGRHSDTAQTTRTRAHPASRSATDLPSTSGSDSGREGPQRNPRSSMDGHTNATRLLRPRANTQEPPSVTSAPRPADHQPRTRSPPRVPRVSTESRTSSDGRIATLPSTAIRHIRHTSTSDPTVMPQQSSTSRGTSSNQPRSAARNPSAAPEISCSNCRRSSIQHDLHYNCSKCDAGNFNVCLRCYRSGKGCKHWFGFGYAAAVRFQRSDLPDSTDQPHILSARRYVDRRVDTPRLDGDDHSPSMEQGLFCDGCQALANTCYWHCETCNDGAWGFCQPCVRTGKHCTHPLEVMSKKSLLARPSIPGQEHSPSTQPSIRTVALSTKSRHDTVRIASLPSHHAKRLPHVPDPDSYIPVSLPCECAICHRTISASASRYHCTVCSDGDYDICTPCYTALCTSGDITPTDGPTGWRRCPRGHRTSVVAYTDHDGGSQRIIQRAPVGGLALQESSTLPPDADAKGRWRWRETDGSSASTGSAIAPAAGQQQNQVLLNAQTGNLAPAPTAFPPDGGVGLRLRALWSYVPSEEGVDELAFPRGADITEAEDINGDWFWGVYAGRKGLFPGNYGRIIGR